MLRPIADKLLIKMNSNAGEFIYYEELLARSIRPVISELCLIDPGTMIACLVAKKRGNIDDLIDSASELLMKPGHLRFGQEASLDIEWGEAPAVSIAMEFRHDSLTAFFDLVFDRSHVGVDIGGILYTETKGDETENRRRFARALADARTAQI